MSLILKNAKYINWETLKFSDTHVKVNEGVNGNIEAFYSIDGIRRFK